MYELLKNLRSDLFVLDVGCDEGSFPRAATSATVVRVDRDVPRNKEDTASFVQCDAAALPFASGIFAVVISNHSLEHIANCESALHEMGRVVGSDGALFVAVPDASTLSDKLYRWLARGGGHINAFTSASELAATIKRTTGLPHVATKVLCSSLSFLNRCHNPGRRPRRALLLGGGSEWSLFLYQWLTRHADRLFHTRTSVYGWALYFGKVEDPIDTTTWVNVCMRCGSGCSGSSLRNASLVRRAFLGIRVYRCPQCEATNFFAHDV